MWFFSDMSSLCIVDFIHLNIVGLDWEKFLFGTATL